MEAVVCAGVVIGMVVLVIAAVIGTRLAEKRARAREAWWNGAMRHSCMYRPADVFVPGEEIVYESVPVPDEDSTETFVQRAKEAKQRQRAHAAAVQKERAERYAAAEAVRRAETEAVIERAYASLGKERQ